MWTEQQRDGTSMWQGGHGGQDTEPAWQQHHTARPTGPWWTAEHANARAERPTRRRRAPGAGDRAQPGKQPENTPSTDFKAPEKPKPLIQFPNHLCYTLEGILGN